MSVVLEKTPGGPSGQHDTLQRFLFPQLGCRGELVCLDATWQQVLARAHYPPGVRDLLGEAFVAAALLSATIKFDGALTLQVNGDGPLHMLVAQARASGGMRGLARHSDGAAGASLSTLCGNGRLAITIETGKPPERYQGVVDLASPTLAAALERYFAQSEQLPTRLWLLAGAGYCSGMLLQRLPGASGESLDADAWTRLGLLTDTITREELSGLGALEILRRTYHEETVQLLDSRALNFECNCCRRTDAMLRALGEREVRAILTEQGAVDVTCEFCNAAYHYDAERVAALFAGADAHEH